MIGIEKTRRELLGEIISRRRMTEIELRIDSMEIDAKEDFPWAFGFRNLPVKFNETTETDIFIAKRKRLISKLSNHWKLPESKVESIISVRHKPWRQVIEELSAESLLSLWGQNE